MLKTTKLLGETPLEMLKRLRKEKPELKDEKLSYAGRLDPMAEGEMLVLVGDEENKNYEQYLGYDKEYIATFLVGVSTDTGDVLGLIRDQVSVIGDQDLIENIKNTIADFTKVTKQKYPWFSSKTVDGKKLFDHYRAGNPENIERPERAVKVYEAELLSDEVLDSRLRGNDSGQGGDDNRSKIKTYIFDAIGKVDAKNDLRQEEILKSWEEYFTKLDSRLRGNDTEKNRNDSGLVVFSVKLKVSSGTYIRALTEQISLPTTLLKLKRTHVIIE